MKKALEKKPVFLEVIFNLKNICIISYHW